MHKPIIFLSFLFAMLVLVPVSISNAQRRPGKEVYRGNITYIGGPRGAFTDFFTLTINSYTPEAEVTRLLKLLKREGQDDFQRAVGKEKRGTMQVGNNLSRDLNAVWVTQTEEGRKIFAIGERWLGFGELRRGGRSLDYPFTYIELYVEDDGDTEGSLFPAARLRAKGTNTLEVENFGIYPARLVNLKQKRK